MNLDGLDLTDAPPIPLLFAKGISDFTRIEMCGKFSLNAAACEPGYIFKTIIQQNNFKYAFLNLFFAGLFSVKASSATSFFLFEKNVLREELELGILLSVSKETTPEHQIRNWESKAKAQFGFSPFAQATLVQAGFMSVIQNEVVDHNLDFISLIVNELTQTKFTHKKMA